MRKIAAWLWMAVLAAGCATAPRPQPEALFTAQSADGEFAGWKSYSENAGGRTAEAWRLETNGVLVCAAGPRGYLHTVQEYTNFKLEFEYRFPAGATEGKGGVLARMTGDHAVWPKSFEFQLNQGAGGDFWGIRGFTYAGVAERYQVVTNSPFGTLRHLKRARNMEKPAGQWNHCEVTIQGDTATHKLNRVLVNQAVGLDVVPGRILLTAEGQEIHFRNLKLTPLP
jgi:hypothetical protein